MVDDVRIDDALADGGRDLEVEDEDRDEVEERREGDCVVGFQHARGDHGGDGVGRVVQAVHEVERNGQHDQQRDDPERGLDGAHASAAQEFSRTTPSIRFATSSQRSVMDSSCS